MDLRVFARDTGALAVSLTTFVPARMDRTSYVVPRGSMFVSLIAPGSPTKMGTPLIGATREEDGVMVSVKPGAPLSAMGTLAERPRETE